MTMRDVAPQCPECRSQPVTFIKGISLCRMHIEQLTQLARRRETKTVGTTSSTLLAALTD